MHFQDDIGSINAKRALHPVKKLQVTSNCQLKLTTLTNQLIRLTTLAVEQTNAKFVKYFECFIID